MLISQNKDKIEEGTIVSIRLTSTEEIVTKFIEEDFNTVTIIHPISLGLGPQGKIVAAPFMIGLEKDTKFKINKTAIVGMVKSPESLKADYIRMTTNIHIPTNSNLGV